MLFGPTALGPSESFILTKEDIDLFSRTGVLINISRKPGIIYKIILLIWTLDDEEQSIPDEPPPAYDDQHEDDDGDKKPLLPSEQGWTQPTLEEKLVQAGLLSVR